MAAHGFGASVTFSPGPRGEEGLHPVPSLPTSGAAAVWNLPAVPWISWMLVAPEVCWLVRLGKI